MTENPINIIDDQIIHLEEDHDDKSFNNEDKYIQLEEKNPLKQNQLLHFKERINPENLKTEQLLLSEIKDPNQDRIKQLNDLGLDNMDLDLLEPKQENIHDFNAKNFPIHLPNSKSQQNENTNLNKNNFNFLDTFNSNMVNNVITHSHSNRTNKSNRSNRSNKSNRNVKNININITNTENNNINDLNDISNTNMLIRNKIEEQKEKEKIRDNNLLDTNLLTNKLLENKTPEEIKALLSSAQNKDQLNDLIEVLIHDKDFMKEFLMVEKKNSNGNSKDNNILISEEEKKRGR
jgi:hypothetical protein